MRQRALRAVFVLYCLLVLATVARAAIDRAPNTTAGAAYYATPSTLVNGDWDVLHTDANHNLFVNVRSGSFPPTPGTATISSFTTTASNGSTPVTLVTGTAAQQIIPYSLTVTNFDTVTHKVQVLTSGGQPLDTFWIVPYGAIIYDGNAAGFAWRTTAGDGLQVVLPLFGTEGGTGTTVLSTGQYIKQ